MSESDEGERGRRAEGTDASAPPGYAGAYRPAPGKATLASTGLPHVPPGAGPGKSSLTQLLPAPAIANRGVTESGSRAHGSAPQRDHELDHESAAPGRRGALPRLDLRDISSATVSGRSSGHGAPRAAPAARVAEAPKQAPVPNAVLKVVALANGQILKTWQSRARWDGPLPQTFRASRAAGGWRWDNNDGRTVKVGTDAQGGGGRTAAEWAPVHADQIIVYAQPLAAVTIDDDAERDRHAPGHATDPDAAGDGSSERARVGAGTRPGEDSETEARGRPAGPGGGTEARAAENEGATGRPHDGRAGGRGSEADAEADADEEDDRLADAFEQDLGIGDGAEDLGTEPGRDGGEATDGDTGEGSSGGAHGGRTGEDTALGGAGPGGDRARSNGRERGTAAGEPEGSEGGSRDGQKDGAEGGMYGGKGTAGDDGVPSGSGLLGGIIGIPAALKGLVEVALIISEGNLTGAGEGLFRRGLGKIASAAAARRMIASEARHAAAKEFKAVMKAIKADAAKARVWNAATKAEREAAMRRIVWEMQRTYFAAYRRAAKQEIQAARAALRKSAGNASAKQKLHAAELAEEATNVMPVAGRLPQNHDYAGQAFPADRLPPQYRSKGVRFTKEGYPDFAPHAKQLPNGKDYVEIEYTGSRRADEAAANKKAGLGKTPDGWTWHHVEDMKRMHLVPGRLHEIVKHSGGTAVYKHGSGVPKYGN